MHKTCLKCDSFQVARIMNSADKNQGTKLNAYQSGHRLNNAWAGVRGSDQTSRCPVRPGSDHRLFSNCRIHVRR